jgi:hypothetical protein
MFEDLSEIAQRKRELAIEEGLSCERCGATSGISREPRGCAYHYDGGVGDKDDPNYASLCSLCWIEERQYLV